MAHHHMILFALVLAAVYAVAGRIARRASGLMPAHGDYWGCAILAVLGFLFAGWGGAGFAAVWFCWHMLNATRSAPHSFGESVSTFLHHAVAAPMAMVVAWVGHHDPRSALWAFCAWASFATSIDWAYARWQAAATTAADGEQQDDPHWWLCILRDAGFGLAVASVLG